MTYSIVARDPNTGDLGVAVQSAWFAVGHDVPWVNAGVGVVATQAITDPTYGARGLTLMRNGLSAPRALDTLTEIDEGRMHRQVAMIDSDGRVAAFTGEACIQHAGHAVGHQVACQGNVLAAPEIPELMVEAFETTTGELVDRLVAALMVAEKAGGDARGRQSAALKVVSGQGTRDLYADRLFDLRIDDHADPINELVRIVHVQRAYRLLDLGHQHLERNEHDQALALIMEAVKLMPEDPNTILTGVTVALAIGNTQLAAEVALHSRAVEIDWKSLIRRLAAVDDFGSYTVDEVLQIFGFSVVE